MKNNSVLIGNPTIFRLLFLCIPNLICTILFVKIYLSFPKEIIYPLPIIFVFTCTLIYFMMYFKSKISFEKFIISIQILNFLIKSNLGYFTNRPLLLTLVLLGAIFDVLIIFCIFYFNGKDTMDSKINYHYSLIALISFLLFAFYIYLFVL